MSQRYFIGSDCSGHNYLVPVEREADWEAWSDEHSWEVPGYAIRLDGGRLTFEAPRICGESAVPAPPTEKPYRAPFIGLPLSDGRMS